MRPRAQTIEVYFFITLPVIWICLFSLIDQKQFLSVFNDVSDIAQLNSLFGGRIGRWGFLFFYIYLYLRLTYSFACWISVRFFKARSESKVRVKALLWSFAFFSLAIALELTLMLIYVKQLTISVSPKDIISASQFYMKLDQFLFGFDPVLATQYFARYPIFDFLLVESYQYIALFFGVVFICLMLFNKEYFRKLLVAIFLVPLISLPFWYKLPAVTPFEMVYENMYSRSPVSLNQEYQRATTSPRLKVFLEKISNTFENPIKQHPLVTTNPSMHVAWGLIITYFAILLWWPLGLIYVPWLLFNMMGTLYTFQHYAIDIPTGILFGFITLLITNYMFKLERKYYFGSYPMFYFIDVFQKDIKNLLSLITEFFTKK